MASSPQAPTTVKDPGRVRELGQAIRDRKLSPVELTRRYLDRIAEADPHVQCWRQLDAERWRWPRSGGVRPRRDTSAVYCMGFRWR